MNKSIYVAGPMNGYPDHNLPAFRDAREFLQKLHWEVRLPPVVDDPSMAAEIISTGRWTTQKEHAAFIKKDLAVVLSCDAIALMSGWPRSRGAMMELNTAVSAGLEVYTLDLSFSEMRSWC